jgi:uncharacterized protein (UPF0335 family)
VENPQNDAAAELVDFIRSEPVATEQLAAIVHRIEAVEVHIADWKADLKEIYAEAKGNGFDTAAIRQIVALRKKDAAERQEAEAILELYKQALGMA